MRSTSEPAIEGDREFERLSCGKSTALKVYRADEVH